MKTYSPRPRDIERRWYVIDANGAVLGRLATEVASILRGKHKPIFAPHMDTGDHVIVVNAAGVQLTGGKEAKKVAYRHSGYPGGLTETGYARLLAQRPTFVVEKAVKGMLPKNRLGRAMVKKLQVYAGPEHPHQAQQPQPLRLGEVPRWEGLPRPKPVPGAAPPEATAPRRRTGSTSTRPSTPAAKRSTRKATSGGRSTAASTTKRTTAKASTTKRTAAKASTTKRSAAKVSTAERTSAKATTAASGAKRTTARRAKKEE
jgi:large subunit ribosomal protein L13